MSFRPDDKKVDYSHEEYTGEEKPGSPTSQLEQSPYDAAGFDYKPNMTPEEKQAALAAAQAADPGISYSDPRFYYFLFVVISVCLCGGDSG